MAVKAKDQITLSLVVDVKATYRYYLLQSSTLTKPAAPTTFPPSSSWTDAEPSYTSGSTNSLYFVDCTVFCDDTFDYSVVSLSSSYEAAKAAYNKAVNAQNTANNAQNSVDNMEIGGTNLLLNSSGPFSATETANQYGSGTLWSIALSTYNHGIKLLPNTQYALSFDYSIDWGSCTPTIPGCGIGLGSTIGNYTLDINHNLSYINCGEVYSTASNGSPITGRFEYVFTTPAASQLANHPYFAMRPGRSTSATALYGSTFTCTNFKLEKGNKVTAWNQAPEDLATNGRLEETNNTLTDVSDEVDDLGENKADKSDLQDVKDDIENNVKVDIQNLINWGQGVNGIEAQFKTVKETADSVRGDYDTYTTTQLKYIRFNDGNIELTAEKTEDGTENFKVIVTNTEIGFYDGADKIAYISNKKLYITEAEIKSPLIIKDEKLSSGHFESSVRSNGNLGTYWVDD